MCPFIPLTRGSHSCSLKNFNRQMTNKKTEYINTVDAVLYCLLILRVDAILFSVHLQL